MTLTDLTPDHAGAAHAAAYRLGKRHGSAAWRDGYRDAIGDAKKPITTRFSGIMETYNRMPPAVLETPRGPTWKVQAPMPHDDTASAVPYGYCQCGCGQKTKLITKTQRDQGDIKGEPRRYINGHQVLHYPNRSPNRYETHGDVTYVYITTGKFSGEHFIVDTADVPRIKHVQWGIHRAGKTGSSKLYVQNSRVGKLHRILLNAPDGYEVDHRNSDGLDNRRSNLRICTRRQNNANSRSSRKAASGYRGVYKDRHYDQWVARISDGPRLRHIGVYPSPEQAARAYDEKARELHGEFARLNFPNEGEMPA